MASASIGDLKHPVEMTVCVWWTQQFSGTNIHFHAVWNMNYGTYRNGTMQQVFPSQKQIQTVVHEIHPSFVGLPEGSIRRISWSVASSTTCFWQHSWPTTPWAWTQRSNPILGDFFILDGQILPTENCDHQKICWIWTAVDKHLGWIHLGLLQDDFHLSNKHSAFTLAHSWTSFGLGRLIIAPNNSLELLLWNSKERLPQLWGDMYIIII